MVVVVIIMSVTLSFPSILALRIQYEEKRALAVMFEQFPVTVDPRNKSIAENAQVNAFLEHPDSPYQAAVGNLGTLARDIFAWVAVAIADTSAYQSLASVANLDQHFVTITSGMRKEQVANAFAKTLSWNVKQKKEFLTPEPGTSFPFLEGSFAPGIYRVTKSMTPTMAQGMVQERFYTDVVSHYGTTTAQIVPLDQALTIASLIEREARGPDDMRIISGIIWNRLFINMRLQIDATLQYVKANSVASAGWWPVPVPADRFRKSPYNTYLHAGLPPTPIANPSVAAILAALNPRETSCFFYFHDAEREFHCTDTYAEHVALLKKYYGRGK